MRTDFVHEYLLDHVDRVHRLEGQGVGRQEAVRRIASQMPQDLGRRLRDYFPVHRAIQVERPATKAARPSARTIRVHLTAWGDHDEYRDVRMPPREDFRPKCDAEVLWTVFIMGQVDYARDHPKPHTKRRSNYKEAEDNTPKFQAVSEGDLIEWNGSMWLIQNRGRSFHQMSQEDLVSYLKMPQQLRHLHRLRTTARACGPRSGREGGR